MKNLATNLTTAAFAAALATVVTTGVASASYPGSQYAGRTHVSLPQACRIATHAVHGTIVSEELEYERGGSGLRYTFDVKTPQGMREVGVDARNGLLLENSTEKRGQAGADGD